MIGFEWTVAKFFWYLFFMYFTFLYFTFYGMMAVGLTPNYNIASILSSAFYGIWNLFSGFIIPRTVSLQLQSINPLYISNWRTSTQSHCFLFSQQIPVWWRWYYWLCPIAWTLYGLVTSQFGDVEEKLKEGPTVAEFVRSYFGFNRSFLWVVALVIVAFPVFFAFLFGFSIKMLNFQRR